MEDIRIISSKVADPRVKGRCKHLLSDILFIGLCTLLSNCEDFEDMVAFGEEREDWLQTKLQLPNGIPSHDTFNQVFQLIDSKQLVKVLREEGQALLDHVEGQLINIDGKKTKGISPKSKGNEGALNSRPKKGTKLSNLVLTTKKYACKYLKYNQLHGKLQPWRDH